MRKAWLIFAFSTWVFAQPGGINGTQLWLRADAGVLGNPVSQWDDQSGNNRNAIQSIASRRPTVNVTDVNFNPSFHYTNHFLDVPYASALNGNDLTVFAVLDLDGGSSHRSPWTTRDDYPQRGHILYYENNRYRYWNGKGSGWSQLTTADTTGNYEIVTTKARDISSIAQSRIEKKVYIQGRKRGSTDERDFSPNTSKPFRIGKGATESDGGNYPWNGDISEIIVYSASLSDIERNRVESYLAIKYGITLYQDSGSTYTDYRESTGAIIWSQSVNDLYRNNIAGLGRDTTSSLDQKISKSINPEAVITMATSSNFVLANTDASRPSLSGGDRRFLLWANRNQNGTWVSSGAPAGGKILRRKWKIQKTGAQNNVNIQVDVDDPDFDIDAFTGTLYFVKGDDLSVAPVMPMTNDGGGEWHIDNIDFNDGDLFSFVVNPLLPDMHITKTSIVTSDPVNGSTHPKRIPGATVRYCFTVDNTGAGDAENTTISDSLTGSGRDTLTYVRSGSVVQDISVACNCSEKAECHQWYHFRQRYDDCPRGYQWYKRYDTLPWVCLHRGNHRLKPSIGIEPTSKIRCTKILRSKVWITVSSLA